MEYIHATYQHHSYKIEGIKFKDTELEWKEQIKHLGVVLHKNLNWLSHCQNQTAKVRKSFRLMGQIILKVSGIKPYSIEQ